MNRASLPIAVVLLAAGAAAAAPIQLKNSGLVVEIDTATGAISAITKLLTVDLHAVRTPAWRIETDARAIQAGAPIQSGGDGHHAWFDHRDGDAKVRLAYSKSRDAIWIEATLEITNA